MHNYEDRQLSGAGFELGVGLGTEMDVDERGTMPAAPAVSDLYGESADEDASGRDGAPDPCDSSPNSASPVDESPRGAKPQEVSVVRCPAGNVLTAEDFMLVMAASSERGARLSNEDSTWCGVGIACVSDGIGGAPFGDVMAKLCCGAFGEAWKSALDDVGKAARRWQLGEWCMYRAFASVDAFVSKVSSCLGQGSGATLVAVAACGGELVFGRMGDSTAYVLRDDGELEHVFGDDSGRSLAGGNALRTAMGYHVLRGGRSAHLQTARVPMREGTRVLLCSDGVWDQLSAARIAELLSRNDDPRAASHRIVLDAVEVGGSRSDNATAIVLDVRRRENLARQQTPHISVW